uniref:Putative secreted protein n=1 Tax=Amblyomma triste TaxID=251400 RepID=A0A023G0S4_AMBTT
MMQYLASLVVLSLLAMPTAQPHAQPHLGVSSEACQLPESVGSPANQVQVLGRGKVMEISVAKTSLPASCHKNASTL